MTQTRIDNFYQMMAVTSKKHQTPVRKMNDDDDDKLFILKLSNHATLPRRSSALAAGLDLTSAENITIPAQGKGIVRTDLSIKVPKGTYGRIAPRSGLACHHHVDIGGGVIDADYRGNIKIIVFNHAKVEFVVTRGFRLAQLIIEKISYPEMVEVQEEQDLGATERGSEGLGSSGN